MSRKRYTPEQNYQHVARSRGGLGAGPVRWSSLSHARRIGAEITIGRKEYGGLRTDQAKRLKDLENGEWPSPEGFRDLGSPV